jgi:hypothetical protein
MVAVESHIPTFFRTRPFLFLNIVFFRGQSKGGQRMRHTAMGGKQAWMLIFILLSILVITGCSSAIKGWSEESFRSADFNDRKLQTEGLAILPVIVLTPSRENLKIPEGNIPPAPYAPNPWDTRQEGASGEMTREAYQLIWNKVLTGKLQSRGSHFNLIPPADTRIRLNDETLSCNYRRFNDSFTQTGLDTDELKCFGQALNSRYVLISQATITEQKSEASLTVIWTFGRKSLLRSAKIYGQLWDTQTGKRMWEGSGVGYHSLSAYEASPLVEQMAGKAVDQLLATFIP